MVTVFVDDGAGASSDTFVLTVAPIDNQLFVSDILDQTTLEDTPQGQVNFTIQGGGIPTDNLTVWGRSFFKPASPLAGWYSTSPPTTRPFCPIPTCCWMSSTITPAP